ncbi:hypothetical protein C8F01DRAFT_1149592 [Mycena amicta]|nr:hypothetical protein C8F01DRAFT_1149592 [Mycena amicta]
MPLKLVGRHEIRNSELVLQLAVSLTSLTKDLADMACFPPATALVAVVLLVVQTAQSVQANKEGCHRLARRCARMVLDVNDQMLGRWDSAPPSLVKNLARLQETVEAIHGFMKNAASASWKTRLLKKSAIEAALVNYHENLDDAARAFQMASLIEIHYAVGTAKNEQRAETPRQIVPLPLDRPLEKQPEIEPIVDAAIYSDGVLRDQGFRRYHQSEVSLRGSPRADSDESWWTGTSEARVNGSMQTSLIKRYEGPEALAREEWIRDIKILQKLYHPNLPQLLGYSSESAPTPFILLSNVKTRSPESFLLGSLRREGVASCIENMLRFYSDVVNATLYVQDQLHLSDDAAQDFLENSSFRIDGSRNVVVGLPPMQDRAVVTWRSYGLNASLRSAVLHMLPNRGIVRYRQDSAVVQEDPTWQLTQLTALVSSLLPGTAEPPGLSSRIQQALRLDEYERPASLRRYRQLSIESNAHGYTWNKNSSILAHKFAVGDLGYIPLGKDWDEFVQMGNLFKDELAKFKVRSSASGNQWCWKDQPMRRSQLQSYELPENTKCWPVAVAPGAQMDCEIVHESSLVRMEDAWEFLLDNAVNLSKKWEVAPESIVLITQAGTNQSFAINDFGGSLQQNMRNAFPPRRGGAPSFFPAQNASVPRIMYLFTSDQRDYEACWSHQPALSPKPPALERGWTSKMGWKTGFINWAQLYGEDFV